MLDNNLSVRSGYSELILTGDIINSLYNHINSEIALETSIFKGYLNYILDNESKAHSDEAGDSENLPLTKVYIDHLLKLDLDKVPDEYIETVNEWKKLRGSDSISQLVPQDATQVSSSFAFLWGINHAALLLAGPGYGKSTVTQFLTLYHATRLLNHEYKTQLSERLNFPKFWDNNNVDS